MVKLADIPKKNVGILVVVSTLCSLSIVGFFFLWKNIIPSYEEPINNLYLILAIVLAVFSLGASFLILFMKDIKPLYIPTSIWIGLLIVFGIVSGIYLIIATAFIQFAVDVWFYENLKKL